MADFYWIGDVSTDAATLANWRTTYGGSTVPTSAITSSDTIYFTHLGEDDCVFGAATSAQEVIWLDKFNTSTVDGSTNTENYGEALRFGYEVEIAAELTVRGMTINGVVTAGASPNITFTSTPIDAESRLVRFGRYADVASTINMKAELTAASTAFYLEPGLYPNFEIHTGTLRPQWVEPLDNTNTEINLNTLDVKTNGNITPTSPMRRHDRKVVILIRSTSSTAFQSTEDDLDFGQATLGIAGRTSTGVTVPIKGLNVTGYGSGTSFAPRIRAFRLYNPAASSDPYLGLIPANFRLCVNHLIIDEGCILLGGDNAEIECVSMPEVYGSLGNFLQVNDGYYRVSPQTIMVPPVFSHRIGGTGRSDLGTSGQVLQVNGAQTGLEWATPSGGGGSGTVTSVDMAVPTGFAISGNPITTTGTLTLAFDTGYSLPTTTKQGQWDTAYGWGDHAGLYEATGAVATHETTFNHAAFLTAETDPVFTAHPAAGVTNAGSGDISQGETAFSWGDHAAAGYLTTESDPVFSGSPAALITNAGSGDVITTAERTKLTRAKARITLTSNQSYSSGTTKVAVDNVVFDTGSDWDSTNKRWVAPRDGHYIIHAGLWFTVAPTSWFYLLIYVNGSYVLRHPSSNGFQPNLAGMVALNANDYVELYVNSNSSSRTIGANNALTWLDITEVV
jgi:hypothetical protein